MAGRLRSRRLSGTGLQRDGHGRGKRREGGKQRLSVIALLGRCRELRAVPPRLAACAPEAVRFRRGHTLSVSAFSVGCCPSPHVSMMALCTASISPRSKSTKPAPFQVAQHERCVLHQGDTPSRATSSPASRVPSQAARRRRRRRPLMSDSASIGGRNRSNAAPFGRDVRMARIRCRIIVQCDRRSSAREDPE